MKKAIGMMALGMGLGASSVFIYDQYKNGNISRAIDKGAKEISKVVKQKNTN